MRPIVVFAPKWMRYQKTARYRWAAASIASAKGAVATLTRSVTSLSIGSLHTGWQIYKDDVRKIPSASLTVEDAEMLLRMYRRGEKVTLHLKMDDRNLGDFVSRNRITELPGIKSQPMVVLSGHLDSWDLGVGALDDGDGSFISWKALELLKLLNVHRPRRTMRVRWHTKSNIWPTNRMSSISSWNRILAHLSHWALTLAVTKEPNVFSKKFYD